MKLTAFLPPGNIQGEIIRRKKQIFRAQGLLSFLALPPLVPLVWGDSLPASFLSRGWPRFTMEFRLVRRGNGIFFPLTLEPDMTAALFSSADCESPGLFPCFPGVYAGDARELPGIPDLPPGDRDNLGWNKSEMVQLSLKTEETGPWWENVFWSQTVLKENR